MATVSCKGGRESKLGMSILNWGESFLLLPEVLFQNWGDYKVRRVYWTEKTRMITEKNDKLDLIKMKTSVF